MIAPDMTAPAALIHCLMASTTLPTSMPVTPTGRGFLYAVCLALLLPAAGFFPMWCAAALRGRRRGPSVLAALAGVVAITCAMILQRTGAIPFVLPVVGLYFVLVTGAMLVFARLWYGKAGAAGEGAAGRATTRGGRESVRQSDGTSGTDTKGTIATPGRSEAR